MFAEPTANDRNLRVANVPGVGFVPARRATRVPSGALSMEWRDEGLIVGVRRHGEHSAIVEAMTRAHGRHRGLVRGGRSARMTAALQPGNTACLPIERDSDVPVERTFV